MHALPSEQDVPAGSREWAQRPASQLSWVMQVIFALYVRCRACLHFPAAAGVTDLSPDLAAFPLAPVLPDACHDDYMDLRTLVVKRFMVPSLEQFSSRDLVDALRHTRVGRALLDICPDRYARW